MPYPTYINGESFAPRPSWRSKNWAIILEVIAVVDKLISVVDELIAVDDKLISVDEKILMIQVIENDKRLFALRAYASYPHPAFILINNHSGQKKQG